MAVSQTLSLRARTARLGALVLGGATREAIVPAVALPIIFLHVRYQPSVHVTIGSARVGIQLSDVAVLAVAAAGVVAGRRLGFASLRRARPLWLAAALLLAWIAVEVLLPLHAHVGYPWQTHGVTAAKFAEYALLAPAAVLVVRRREDLRLLLGVLVAWSVVATAVGLVQFFGGNILASARTGGRQPSFLGFHDFAALSGAALVIAIVAIALPRLGVDARLGWIAAASGGLGVIVSAAVAGVIGLAAAGIALFGLAAARHELDLRRLLAAGAVLAVSAAGVAAMRGSDLDQFLRFLGVKPEQRTSQEDVQSYSQRTVLAYIGWRIFLDHPLAGVGFEASGDPPRFTPYIQAAHRKFPHVAPIAFPSEQRRYGVQNLYVQTLADLGLVGALFLVATFVTAGWLALRGALGPRPLWGTMALLWTLLAAGLWAAQGIVAGIPFDALTWLAFGLAAGSVSELDAGVERAFGERSPA